MTKLTNLETQVMSLIPADNFYEEGFESVLWSDIFASDCGLESKKVRGVMTSLIKKNMIWTEKAMPGEQHGTMGLTSEGIDWMKQNLQLDENGFMIKNSENSNNEGEIVMNEVKVEGQVEEVIEAVEEVEVEAIENAEVEVVSENEEIEAADVIVGEVEVISENVENSDNSPENEKVDEKPKKPAGRAAGIGVQFYVNDELQDVFPSIQAAARELKVYLKRETMPYTIIHKSIRDFIDYTHTDGEVIKFRFENEADKKDEYKTRTSTSSGTKGAGKLVDWFENGEFKQQFSSIKAAVEFMKTYLKLPHNPYTAVLKSLNENQDFNQHSFKFGTEVREAAQAVASDEPQQAAEEVVTEVQEIVEVDEAAVELSENEVVEAE